MAESSQDAPGCVTPPSWSEAERLAALERYGVLDSGRESAFDDIAALAADIFDAPIAVVNFVAGDRQWFKAEVGIGTDTLPLDVSICRHALLQPGVFVVPDLAGDARFENNPLVKVAGGLRFYAGALIATPEGLPLGTVCVLDREPRPRGIGPGQERALRTLAGQTMALLELRRNEAAVRESESRFRNMADHAPVMMWVTDPSGHCTYLNKGWYEFTGQPPHAGEGYGWLDAVHPDDRKLGEQAFLSANAERRPYNVEFRLRGADGAYRWVIDAAAPRFDDDGAYLGYVGSVIDIQDRYESEAALRLAADRFRAAVDAFQGIVWTNDPSGRMVGEQPGWSRLTGQSREQYQGFGWSDAVHPDDAAPTVEAWNLAVAERRPFEFEHRLRRADGLWCRYAVRAVPVFDPDGEISEWVGVHADITAQAEAEARLRQSEAWLRAVFDAVPVGLVLAEAPSGRIIGGNSRVEEVFGHPVLPSAKVEDYREWVSFHADGRRVAGHEHPLSRALRSEAERPELEVLYQRGDGRKAWIRLVAAAVHDDAGQVIGGVVACLDIDREKRAEAALREERDLVRDYLHVAEVMILVLDGAGVVRTINRRGAEILGHDDPESLIGRDWFELAIPPAHRSETRAVFAKLMAGEFDPVSAYENPVLRVDGEERLVAWRNTLLKDERGRIVGTLSSGDDITDQRLAQDRERLLAQEIDHRAKNLLAVVQSVVQLTRAEDMRAFKEAVTGRIQSLARTHGLLAATRWEGADLKQLVADELAPYSRNDPAAVDVSGPALRLTPAAAQAFALAIHELATNSAKYGALGAPTGRLKVRWQWEAEAGPRLRLRWIEEGGPPVTPPTRRGFGSVVLQSSIERQLKGEVLLDWRAEGLVCELLLPGAEVITRGSAPPKKGPALPVNNRGGSTLERLNVLVVEDEALVAAQIEDVLTEEGHDVVVVSRLSDAFDRLYRDKPDVALLDINIAGERSYPLADLLLAKGVPFAFCSGYGESAGLPAQLAQVPMIAKPFDPGELSRIVAALNR